MDNRGFLEILAWVCYGFSDQSESGAVRISLIRRVSDFKLTVSDCRSGF